MLRPIPARVFGTVNSKSLRTNRSTRTKQTKVMKINHNVGEQPTVGYPRQIFSNLVPKKAYHRAGKKKIILVMKLTIFIMATFLLQLSAATKAQITLNENGKTLQKVLKLISKQSGYDFIYADQAFKNANPVTIKLKNADINKALALCFAGQPLVYEISDKTVMIKERQENFSLKSAMVFPVKIDVRGKIVDEKGQPVPGASIAEKGAKNVVSSSGSGDFVINVKDKDAILVISFVGYQSKEVLASSVRGISITLTPSQENLNDVVVVGYGTQKKANLTGAVSTVDKELLQNRPVTRLSQMLQGAVPNLNILNGISGGAPNATQSINIRGYTGFGASGSPLIVIDGIPGGDINTINANDIENISVLKDQASSSIYGVDGAFGVILISTKQGKKGTAPQFSYNNNFSFSQFINTPKAVSSLEYVNMFNEASVNGGAAPIYPEEQIQRVRDYLNGTLKTETMPNSTGTDWINGQLGNANNDWFKILFKDWGQNQQHNISLNGGSNNITYYLGAGYQDKEGMLAFGNDDFKLYNFRGNLGVDVTQWAKINVRSSFSRSRFETAHIEANRTGGGLSGLFHNAARFAPVVPLYNPDGNISNFNDAGWQAYGGRNISNQDQVQLTGEFILSPIKGLNITGNYTVFANNAESADQGKTFFIPRPDGSLATFGTNPSTFSRSFSKNNNSLTNLFATYEKSVGEHNFKILGGYIRRFNQSLFLSASNSNLYSQNLPALSLTYNDKPIVSDEVQEYATEGFFTRFNYDYKGKFLLEFDGRYDATSKFIANRWQFYPGVSAGYVVSKENFWKNIEKVVNTLKFRGSYGQSGDQNSFGNYPFYQSLSTTIPANTNWFFSTGRQASVSAPGVVNPLITWQKPIMVDFGIDATFLNNRLSATFDWYKRTMKDLVVPSAPLPAVFGTAAPNVNGGEIETTGFELATTWKDQFGSVKYSLTASLSDYQGKVTKHPNVTKILSDWFVGRKIGDIYGYTTTGLYASDSEAANALPTSFSAKKWVAGDVIYIDSDGSGRIDNGKNTADSPGDLTVIGNNTPRYTYGLNANLQWKNFDLNIFVQGVGKRDLWVSGNYFWGIIGDRFQSSYFTEQRDDRWTPDNLDGYFPKYYMNTLDAAKSQQVQTRYLQNAAYLRIKNLQLGYSLPKQLLSKWHVGQLRVFAGVENLATFTKLIKTLDPELAGIDSDFGQVGTGKVYPLQRTISFGLNFSL